MTPHVELLIHLRNAPLTVATSIPPMALGAWRRDWLWSLPIIATTVVFHAFGLKLLNQSVSALLKARPKIIRLEILSAVAVGGTAFGCVVLHGCEAFMWAIAYRMLGAMSISENAMLYSLDAMTTYGQSGINLQPQWQLLGSLEALNGWILFGLTTAFLFNVIQEIWVAHSNPPLA